MLQVVDKINKVFDLDFDSTLINYYESGDNYVSPHRDDENIFPELVDIVSLSLGETRKFHIYPGDSKSNKVIETIVLEDNDLLFIPGEFNNKFRHGIPKEKDKDCYRYSMTFRVLKR